MLRYFICHSDAYHMPPRGQNFPLVALSFFNCCLLWYRADCFYRRFLSNAVLFSKPLLQANLGLHVPQCVWTNEVPLQSYLLPDSIVLFYRCGLLSTYIPFLHDGEGLFHKFLKSMPYIRCPLICSQRWTL